MFLNLHCDFMIQIYRERERGEGANIYDNMQEILIHRIEHTLNFVTMPNVTKVLIKITFSTTFFNAKTALSDGSTFWVVLFTYSLFHLKFCSCI